MKRLPLETVEVGASGVVDSFEFFEFWMFFEKGVYLWNVGVELS